MQLNNKESLKLITPQKNSMLYNRTSSLNDLLQIYCNKDMKKIA